jgi:hypothetical protein
VAPAGAGVTAMRTLIWSLTALLAAAWTGFIALAHQLTGWLLGAIDTGSLQGAAGTVGGLALPPVPAWLAPWIDTASLATLQSMAVSLVQWLGAVLPSGDALMAWVGPLLWVGWAMVLIPMLVIAGLLHWLVGRVPAQQTALRGAGA